MPRRVKAGAGEAGGVLTVVAEAALRRPHREAAAHERVLFAALRAPARQSGVEGCAQLAPAVTTSA